MSSTLHPWFVSAGEDNKDAWIRIRHEELIIHRRYEVISIINDLLMALWFLIGSILFFYPSWTYAATWFFTIGSAEFLIRPLIRLAHSLHVKRIPGSTYDM